MHTDFVHTLIYRAVRLQRTTGSLVQVHTKQVYAKSLLRQSASDTSVNQVSLVELYFEN